MVLWRHPDRLVSGAAALPEPTAGGSTQQLAAIPARPIPASPGYDGSLTPMLLPWPGPQAAWRYYSLPNVLAALSLAIAAATALAVPATAILLGEVQPRVPWLDCYHMVDAAWSRLVPWCTVALFVFIPFAQLHDEVRCTPPAAQSPRRCVFTANPGVTAHLTALRCSTPQSPAFATR